MSDGKTPLQPIHSDQTGIHYQRGSDVAWLAAAYALRASGSS
jgi:hypothetical protein